MKTDNEADNRDIVPIYLRMAAGDIAYAKFLFESYEEVGIVRTIDRQAAIIVVLAVRDLLTEARAIVEEIKSRIDCDELDEPPGDADDWLMASLD